MIQTQIKVLQAQLARLQRKQAEEAQQKQQSQEVKATGGNSKASQYQILMLPLSMRAAAAFLSARPA